MRNTVLSLIKIASKLDEAKMYEQADILEQTAIRVATQEAFNGVPYMMDPKYLNSIYNNTAYGYGQKTQAPGSSYYSATGNELPVTLPQITAGMTGPQITQTMINWVNQNKNLLQGRQDQVKAKLMNVAGMQQVTPEQWNMIYQALGS